MVPIVFSLWFLLGPLSLYAQTLGNVCSINQYCCLGVGKCANLENYAGSCCPRNTQCCLQSGTVVPGAYTCCSGGTVCTRSTNALATTIRSCKAVTYPTRSPVPVAAPGAPTPPTAYIPTKTCPQCCRADNKCALLPQVQQAKSCCRMGQVCCRATLATDENYKCCRTTDTCDTKNGRCVARAETTKSTATLLISGSNCNKGFYLGKYNQDPNVCMKLVLDMPKCDNTYFSHGSRAGNCWCVTPGTDCAAVANQDVQPNVNTYSITTTVSISSAAVWKDELCAGGTPLRNRGTNVTIVCGVGYTVCPQPGTYCDVDHAFSLEKYKGICCSLPRKKTMYCTRNV